MTTMPTELDNIKSTLKRLEYVIDGDPMTDTPGIRKRMKAIEDFADEVRKERIRNRWVITGVAVGIGLAQGSVLVIVLQLLQIITGPLP